VKEGERRPRRKIKKEGKKTMKERREVKKEGKEGRKKGR
jgi:hypothetical protein